MNTHTRGLKVFNSAEVDRVDCRVELIASNLINRIVLLLFISMYSFFLWGVLSFLSPLLLGTLLFAMRHELFVDVVVIVSRDRKVVYRNEPTCVLPSVVAPIWPGLL